MSRIGLQPISLPQKVSVDMKGQQVTVKGPKGQLDFRVHPDMAVKLEDNVLSVARPSDHRDHKALHGLTRALLANMVTGVSEGFRRSLTIEGVGYTSEVRGKDLVLKVGHSHEVVINPPDKDTEFTVEDRGRLIHVDGIDKQVVGQVASDIREVRPPEPYLGKGIRYQGEFVRRKAGKAAK
jgi:large subunit ribosomal protein L6